MEMSKSPKDMLKAGTGFMANLADTLRGIQGKGYSENLTPKFDHFEARSGEIRLMPHEFSVDDIVRFENTSDPDDQAILYAISAPSIGIKGVYVESFSLTHDDLSVEMLNRLKIHPN